MKRSGDVVITGLTLNILRKIVVLKVKSTYDSILYYAYGKAPSSSCLITNCDWQMLVQNILPSQIKLFIKNLET